MSNCLLRSNSNIVLHACGRLPWFSRRRNICRLGPLLLSALLLFALAGQVCCSFLLPQSKVLPSNIQAMGRQEYIWNTLTCLRVRRYRDHKLLTFHVMQLWVLPNLVRNLKNIHVVAGNDESGAAPKSPKVLQLCARISLDPAG